MMRKLISRLGITDRASFLKFRGQVFRFGIVGTCNTIIAFTVYYILIYHGVHYMVASAISFAVAICNAYFWNSRYIFPQKNNDDGVKPFAKLFLAYGSTLLLSLVLAFCIVEILHISEWLVPPINLSVTVPLNFLLNKFWVFRDDAA